VQCDVTIGGGFGNFWITLLDPTKKKVAIEMFSF